MEIDFPKWSRSGVFISHEEHTDHPKEEDIMTRLEDICRVVFFEESGGRIEIPVQYRKWPEGAREPSIEYIIIPPYESF